MSHVKDYFEEMAVNEKLELIDEHKFVELVYADIPDFKPPVKVRPILRVISNLWIEIAIGVLVGVRKVRSALFGVRPLKDLCGND